MRRFGSTTTALPVLAQVRLAVFSTTLLQVVSLVVASTTNTTTTTATEEPSSSSSRIMTIGIVHQHMDALLSHVDGLSSTTLYALVVGATIVVSLTLLGSAKEGEIVSHYCSKQQQPISKLKQQQHAPGTAAAASSSSSSVIPEPQWHIFRYMNILILVLFVASIVEFVYWNEHYSSSSFSLWAFLLGWSVFLCYFFGFFGVTFVHDITASAETERAAPPPSSSSASTSTTTSTSKQLAYTNTPVSSPSKVDCQKSSTNSSCSKALDKGCGVVNKTSFSVNSSSKTVVTAADTNKNGTSDTTTTTMSEEDEEFVNLVLTNQLKDHELERRVGDCHRAVAIRRQVFQRRGVFAESSSNSTLWEDLPYENYDYAQVHGTNCEIVIGYVPIPVGLVGPLQVNGVSYHVPMATTEGCLVASTNRGCKALDSSKTGVAAVVTSDAITRAPCIRLPSAVRAGAVKIWCDSPENFAMLQRAFESTTSFGKLRNVQATVAGRNVYLRLSCFSGDAMGMNMVSKGSLAVIECLSEANHFPDLKLVALSGNMCTDKKAAATNWIHGRGKSVVVEATVPASIVKSVLKTTVKALVDTNLHKNLIGSAMAGTVGGFNAHASNIVTAVFLATGQDPAQNVESSNCITLMEEAEDGSGDLWISCTMPSLEVGTVGGGTSLKAQSACLKMLGCQGGSKTAPGENAQKLATIVAATVMAGELSLLAALAANTLVQAHMQHNRKK